MSLRNRVARWGGVLAGTIVIQISACKTSDSTTQGQESVGKQSSEITFNVMAPLHIVDSNNDGTDADEWRKFEQDLAAIKQLGAYGVTTDVWWGMAEPKDDQFDWSYYDRLAATIADHGLKWIPILSFHQCGGNVGDTCDIPIPAWLWEKDYGNESSVLGFELESKDLMYESEQGNVSRETLSAWATPIVRDEYRDFMQAFAKHFADRAGEIAEINISLGSAGELRYPSYNSHDEGSGYPTRGALQAYSRLAVKSFQKYAVDKYGSWQKVAAAWKDSRLDPIKSLEDIQPPNDVDSFVTKELDGKTQYGLDFHDWYHQSLIEHGKQMMEVAIQIFANPSSVYQKAEIGAKVPGVHWLSQTTRHAELAAGLLRTSDSIRMADSSRDVDGKHHGYGSIIGLFKSLAEHRYRPRIVLHFTCLEMRDNPDDSRDNEYSLAKQLVGWVGDEAHRQGVLVKGENALAWELGSPASWDNISHAVANHHYHGVTFLRVSDIVGNSLAEERFRQLVQNYQ